MSFSGKNCQFLHSSMLGSGSLRFGAAFFSGRRAGLGIPMAPMHERAATPEAMEALGRAARGRGPAGFGDRAGRRARGRQDLLDQRLGGRVGITGGGDQSHLRLGSRISGGNPAGVSPGFLPLGKRRRNSIALGWDEYLEAGRRHHRRMGGQIPRIAAAGTQLAGSSPLKRTAAGCVREAVAQLPRRGELPVADGIRLPRPLNRIQTSAANRAGQPAGRQGKHQRRQAIHWRSRFMSRQACPSPGKSQAVADSPRTFFLTAAGISSTLRTFTGCQPSTTGRSVRVILAPFDR